MANQNAGDGGDAIAAEIERFAHRPSIDGMPTVPIRSPIELSPAQITGEIDIPWLMPYPAEYEGTIEPLAILTLSMCCDVHAIAAQGVKKEYGEGKKRFHFPDLWVASNGPRLVEIKSFKELMREKSLTKYAAIGKSLADEGIDYRFLVDIELKTWPRQETVATLSRYVNSDLNASSVGAARHALSSGKRSIQTLIGESGGRLSLADVYCQIAHRILAIDWNVPLTRDAEVSLPNQPFQGLRFDELFSSSRHNDLLARLAVGDQPTDQQRMEALPNQRWRKRAMPPHEIVGGFPTRARARSLRKSASDAEATDGRTAASTCHDTGSDSPTEEGNDR